MALCPFMISSQMFRIVSFSQCNNARRHVEKNNKKNQARTSNGEGKGKSTKPLGAELKQKRRELIDIAPTLPSSQTQCPLSTTNPSWTTRERDNNSESRVTSFLITLLSSQRTKKEQEKRESISNANKRDNESCVTSLLVTPLSSRRSKKKKTRKARAGKKEKKDTPTKEHKNQLTLVQSSVSFLPRYTHDLRIYTSCMYCRLQESRISSNF
ncbi:hypothetical protein K435DRAFT_524923 [Dendrothele bispora CBS 962.96]|uniref:Uncharacterized protein n=1 Tax=Dendrothele bispora (strain CBS 962.96) TaxID=1314807 RepID=A0A4S8M9X3_DENBC|nr:hypothetical protein K435DRAFT_524923 [Dendrothele bispora CBS 962.96]